MLPCHSYYSYGTWKNKKLGGIKFIVWREAEGVSHKVKGEHFFMEELTPQIFYQNYLPVSALFGLNRVI